MREIKFRARNANIPPCWIYGYFVIERGSCYIINDSGKFQVIAGTERQFTGLNDKNGKEIYEGDILQRGTTISDVVWEDCGFKLRKGNSVCDVNKPIEIIGNIYENPELLEAEK